ncbi:exodeoxyribonuclease VII large subunit [Gallibacterium salpingitidis]|uniref:Exodeoxyribonuclease 7 large subunit n=1 Tax=Gallibacterium salpingitidis TaxID=505341 RepID=A0AB36E4H8_9PAST|nr:exodeoxyribonuclease VII large subunit [Gallibacterium salpingitidis]OBX08480.1 exodeoxyribonuclease VII large subunit [Gallibacterium salpingitidis]OBX11665.1 exodeoxyribonuclease VII large subunit [Gallibacterium salpingitidis]
MMLNQTNLPILSISQLNRCAKELLEQQLGSLWLTGEISNFTQPVSGHWYFTLKDNDAQVRAAMFRMRNLRVAFKPQNGMQVLVKASVSLYEPRGDYQIIVDSMQPAGEGLLQQQFEQLKMKLAAEGLFAQQWKKPLPSVCQRIGVITSSSGAALHDILQILRRRNPSLEVVIYPTLVQGKEAAQDIVRSIEIANARQECDVLIVGRGGGSLEDLWCFNEEIVARAIFASSIPIISAVGHETDVTIADFVADLRASTPSAAAELLSRDQKELWQKIDYLQQRLEIAFNYLINQARQRLEKLQLRLQNQHPQTRLALQKQQYQYLNDRLYKAIQLYLQKRQQQQQRLQQRLWQIRLSDNILYQQQNLQQWHYRLTAAMNMLLQQQRYQLSQLSSRLDSISPLKVLQRGYTVTTTENHQLITSAKQVAIGQMLITKTTDGRIVSNIVEIKKN